ncbi:MAG: hypothetical protein JSV91_11520 [Phycisphaerales bacterium]|nr:MAG: hypothetical protein JSV91_11520 [Phycisphaerales bacterium]
MEPISPWRQLCRTDDPHLAVTIVTTIAAMEFPARLRDAATGELIEQREDIGDGPFIIETHGTHHAELADVLEEIIGEQEEFDEALESRDRFVRRVRRIVLLGLIIIVTVLAVFKLITL